MSTATDVSPELVTIFFNVLHYEENGDVANPRLYPIRDNGRLIVTDGRICFDFPEVDVSRYRRLVSGAWVFTPPTSEKQCHTDYRDVFKNLDFSRLHQIPEIQPPKGFDEWYWSRSEHCDECTGSGYVECEYGHEHDCPDCEGRGQALHFHTSAKEPIHIDGVPLGTRYLWMISKLPNAMLGSVKHTDYVGFTFDGGKGVLARMLDL